MNNNKEKVMLIDGNSIINRAFYGLPSLTNKDGIYTNGVYGFLNIFFKLYEEEMPNYIAVAFDLKGPTFRHNQFEGYKSQRKSMPEELATQMPILKDTLKTMNIQIFELEGYEADDILGTLSVESDKNGMDVVLISGDRDMLQLATSTVKVRIPKTKGGKTEIEDYYERDVINIFGVTPKEYIDVKALMGDTSDNIPGVPSIGEKTALKIISQYKSIEEALKNHDNIMPKRIGESLINNKEVAIMSKELATIVTDTPVNIQYKPLSKKDIFNPNFKQSLEKLEFKSIILKYFDQDSVKSITKNNFYTQTITNKMELNKIFNIIATKESVALAIVNFANKSIGISVSFEDKGIKSFFMPFSDELNNETFLENFKIIERVKNLYFYDSKNFLNFLKKDIKISFDSMLAAYILNIDSSLEGIGKEFLGIEIEKEEDLAGKGKNRRSFNDLSDDEKESYGCTYSFIVFSSYKQMDLRIKDHKQEDLYYNIELPLAKVLSSMERFGIKIDRMALVDYENQISQDINKLTQEIYMQAGEEFNINSPSQMGTVLFEKLGLKGSKKTKTGYSTAADVLEKIKHTHPIIESILKYRMLSKLKSTYCEGLLNVTNPSTDKIHTTYNQTIASTGRISSIEPNLQNIPIRMELGRKLRKVFIPSDDSFTFLDADYSQIELRILAHLSRDPNMIAAYKNGEDIHRATAAQVLGIPQNEVSNDQRSSAKAINFGIIYGISGFSLSQDLRITKKEADKYIASYFKQYPNVKQYLDTSIANAKENGYGITIFGRRRLIPELFSSNFITRGFGERVAMNMPIQGSAADIIKIAMINVFNRLNKEKLKSRLILTVHDELLVETKINEIDQVKSILRQEMESAAQLLVPLEVEVHEGGTWYHAK